MLEIHNSTIVALYCIKLLNKFELVRKENSLNY